MRLFVLVKEYLENFSLHVLCGLVWLRMLGLGLSPVSDANRVRSRHMFTLLCLESRFLDEGFLTII